MPAACGAQGARELANFSGSNMPMFYWVFVLALLAAAASGLPLPAKNAAPLARGAANHVDARGRQLEVLRILDGVWCSRGCLDRCTDVVFKQSTLMSHQPYRVKSHTPRHDPV